MKTIINPLRKLFILSLFVIFSSSTQLFAQNYTKKPDQFLTSIFIHTSKPYYLPGEKIWLSAYLTNATNNQLLAQKQPLFLQLYNSEGLLVSNKILYTEAGRGDGVVALLPTTPAGIYRLRAFTQNMLITEQTKYEQLIYIGVKPNKTVANTAISSTNSIKINTNNSSFQPRNDIQLKLQLITGLEATVSVSVYKENAPITDNIPLIYSSPTPNDFTTTEPTDQLIYMGRAVRPNGSFIANGQ